MIDNYKIKEFLANKEVFRYLDIADSVGNHDFILKYKPLIGDFAIFIAVQNTLRAKAKIKLPNFEKHGCFYTVRSLEQCTDEAVARYKSTKIAGKNLLTLAAGLGADDAAFSDSFEQITSVDNHALLNTIAIHNFKLLGIKNITRITETAENLIHQNNEQFDAVYIDPDRREGNIRQILLSHHQPDVIQLLPELLKISNNIWIKCSPLYDIDMALKEVNNIVEIYCISLRGEVKEMLLKVAKKTAQEISFTCIDINSNRTIEEKFTSENNLPNKALALTGFFYEAGASLVKVRKHHSYAAKNNLSMIDAATPFYTSNLIVPNFIGKCMTIIDSFPFNNKQLKLYLKTKSIHQINIKARGIKMDTIALFKQLSIKEGGEEFLFICPFQEKNMVIHCQPLKNFSSVVNNEV